MTEVQAEHLNLGNFETFPDCAILARGQEYFADGRVQSITAKGNEIVAEVLGSEPYTVTLTIDDDGNIIETGCDCPYDYGVYCKHQAALFFALRERDGNMASDGEERTENELLTILQAQTKGELIDLVMSLARADRTLATRLVYEQGQRTADVASALELMQGYINRFQRDGMISYHDTDSAAEGIYIVLSSAAKQRSPLLALQLYRAVLAKSMDLLQIADDSDGNAGNCIGSAISGIAGLSEESCDTLPAEDRRKLFRQILEEAGHPRYRGWDDWSDQLLQACVPLCDLPDCRTLLDQQLKRLLNQQPDDENWNFRIRQLKLIQLTLVQCFDGQQAAAGFIQQNVTYPEFRELAIDQAMQVKDYEQVLSLAANGCQADTKWPGLVRKWNEYAYAAYQALDDTANVRRLARQFILGGSFAHYQQLKATYPATEWPPVMHELLAEMEKKPFVPSTYVDILIAENLQDRLMAHCKRTPEEVFSLHSRFDPIYAPQVNELFLIALRHRANVASKRSAYRNLCQDLKTYAKVCGKANAASLRQDLQETYRRRPALLDELSRLRF